MCVSTGNRYADIGLSIAVGAATGGFGVGAGTSSGIFSAKVGSSVFQTLGMTSATLVPQAALGGAIIGGASALAYQALVPQQNLDPSQYTSFSYDKPFNAQQNTITGSGGAQAPALLASEIKRVKDARKRQESVGDTALNIESFDQTGLQLA